MCAWQPENRLTQGKVSDGKFGLFLKGNSCVEFSSDHWGKILRSFIGFKVY